MKSPELRKSKIERNPPYRNRSALERTTAWVIAVAAGWQIDSAFAAPTTPETMPQVEHADHTIPTSTQTELKTWFDQSTYTNAGITITGIDPSTEGKQSEFNTEPYIRSQPLNEASFAEHRAVVLEDDTTNITLRRSIERKHCTFSEEWDTQPMMSGTTHVGTMGKLSYTDKFNNDITVRRGLPDDPNQPCYEFIDVTTPFQYETADQPAMLAVQFDLSQVNDENLDGAMYRKVVPLRGEFDHESVFSNDLSHDQLQGLIEGGMSDGYYYTGMQGTLSKGIDSTTRLYGLSSEVVKRIHVVDTGFVQAEAMMQTDTVMLHADILRDADGLTNSKTREHVIEHETTHLIDAKFGISNDARFQALWSAIPKDQLPMFNESNFLLAGFGGHSETSPAELFASFMNGLDDAQPLAERLKPQSPVFRHTYHDVAVLVKTILAEKNVPNTVPIVGLLDQAISLTQ